MRLWIDTDIGDDPDDTVALYCARHAHDMELVGVSTVDGDVHRRAELARRYAGDVPVIAGPPPGEQLANVEALLGIGPWTNIARLADESALPPRVVVMGGALGPVKHHGAVHLIEYNVGRDPTSAARLLNTTGNLIVVPLDATARLEVGERDEAGLTNSIPGLREQIDTWRTRIGDYPLVLHDPAALLVAAGEHVARFESRRLQVEPDGTMLASVDRPLQRVVAHIDADLTRARVRALAWSG
jgi:inosine-uridine nucleoside N-ribohydrolase